MERRDVVLMTATVVPRPSQPGLVLVDPSERLRDYRNALTFYSGLLERGAISDIVFVENSGFDLSALANEFPSPRIEWVGFTEEEYSSSFHRGYGEFRLIDQAYQRSRVLMDLDARDRVWKVTGRYVVKNMALFVRLSPRRADLYCDMKNGWAEMSVMAWSPHGYNTMLKGLWRRFATPTAPELILAELIRATDASRCHIVSRFFWQPFIVGRRGGDGTAFQGRFTRYRLLATAVLDSLLLPFRLSR